MKTKSFVLTLLAVALCFYGCESSSLDESKDDSSTTVPSEDKQETDDGTGKTDPDDKGDDDDDEVVELPTLSDLGDVDYVCIKMTDLDFMRYCYENFDVNGDAKVSMYEANAVKEITCNTAEDFTGIEYFPNLESFESTSAKYLDLKYNAQLSDIKNKLIKPLKLKYYEKFCC